MRQLARYMDVTGARFYVMEKLHGGVVKNRAKVGVHIVCPDVVLAPETQLAVRAAVLPEVGELLARYTDNTAAECFDEAVIARNNWIMYGSSKQDAPPYQVTRAFRVGPDGGLVEASLEADDPCDYVELFSIRSKRELTPLVATAPVKSEVVRKHVVKGEVVRVARNQQHADVEEIGRLVMILSRSARTTTTRGCVSGSACTARARSWWTSGSSSAGRAASSRKASARSCGAR